MKFEQTKKYRRDLLTLLEGEREQVLAAANEADAIECVLSDPELKSLMARMGHPKSGCPTYHRKELGYSASATRWRQYRKLRNKKGKK